MRGKLCGLYGTRAGDCEMCIRDRLGGVEITETVKESAREMRALAKSKKSGFEK